MHVTLTVTAGPHLGQAFTFDGHDTFLVGRTKDAHFRLSYDDPYFSRRHFLIEVNPPRCRILDLKSRNGIRVNGIKVPTAELKDGDEVGAGHTTFRLGVVEDNPDAQQTIDLPSEQSTIPPRGEIIEAMPVSSAVPELAGYRIENELARGGMGVVYRGVRLSDSFPVAIKTIKPVAGTSRRDVERFLREAKILGELRHRHIVGFLDAGEAGPVLFMVMQLVDGLDASRMLAKHGPFDVRVAVRVVCQLLSALEYAHGRGVVHRDIKPANVLIGGRPGKRVVKLADFGLARLYEASKLSGLTMQGEIGGTPTFMAPEQVTHYREVKPAADQYSAAATLYTLLTGKFIFDFPVEPALALIKIITDDPNPIRSHRADVPADLAEVIHKALRREPEERYADVAEFRRALARFG